MSFNEILSLLVQVLEFKLFDVGTTPVTIATILTVLMMLVGTLWLSKVAQRTAERILVSRGGTAGTAGTVKSLIHYIILIVGFAAALQTAGIDLTALFAAGAIFAIGLGIAMQSIAQNFVAGFILLTERTIKPGDILEVEGRVVRVASMGIRAIVARSRDGEELIIPNHVLVSSTVKNYTLADAYYRMQVAVGVVYRSDMALVRSTLEETAEEIAKRWGVTDPAPLIVMNEFGDNAVQFKVAIWMPDPWQWLPAINELHEAIWWAFKKQDIVIAFPQLDVHFDSPIEPALRRSAGLSD
jgi:small-conductance mechanosensitive channel